MISASSSVMGAAFGQLQQQQATRLADQYEARAASLRAQARSAQTQADRATQQAGNLTVQADQAQGRADTAKTTVASAQTAGETVKTQSAQTVQALQRAQNPPAVGDAAPAVAAGAAPSASAGFSATGLLNLQGQRIGMRVNVSV